MVIDYISKQKKRFHHDCHKQHLEDQEFKRKEKEELDQLVETIKEVHNIEVFPNQFYSYLQDLRNGNELFGRIGQKKSKEGYTYKVIAETYRYCKDNINWAMNNRDFSGTLNMLLYTRAIVKDKIAQVDYRIKKEQHKREVEVATEEQAKSVFEHTNRQPVKYKKTKSRVDASSFLD